MLLLLLLLLLLAHAHARPAHTRAAAVHNCTPSWLRASKPRRQRHTRLPLLLR
jgi:hypothetical protein